MSVVFLDVTISRYDTTIDTTFQVNQLKQFESINSKNPSDKTHATWSATSKVRIDENRTFIWKPITSRYEGYDVVDREVCILNHLSNFSWAPKLLWYNSSGLVTNYVDEPLSVYKIPLDYKEQLQKIVDDMKSVGINHGDIYKECHPRCDTKKKENEQFEFMVQEESGKTFASLSLVDFGWATKDGSYQCKKNMAASPHSDYKPDNDDEIFPKLDETFRHHLKLEQHFMVDWTRHYTEQHIRKKIKEISPNLSIRKMVEHPAFTDNKERVRVFSKFYHTKVDDLRGKTPFNMYFLYDHKPNYDFRPTSKGERIVNTAMLDLKRALRNEMGGGFKIHTTDNIQETRENMEALEMPHEYHQRQFDTLRRIFDVLNFSGLEYVVLRNFEKMPDEVKVDPNHLDVDLLVSNYYEAKRLLDGINPDNIWTTSYENGKHRVVNSVVLDGKLVNFDIRYTGDNYLDKKWQLDILKNRVRLRQMFVPSKADHLHSLIYHAIIQKKEISDTYVKMFQELGNYTEAQSYDKKFLRQKLDTFMDGRGYKMVKPKDDTVGYFS